MSGLYRQKFFKIRLTLYFRMYIRCYWNYLFCFDFLIKYKSNKGFFEPHKARNLTYRI